jgi:hypothetical protein
LSWQQFHLEGGNGRAAWRKAEGRPGAESGMMLISQSPLVPPGRVVAVAVLFAASLILAGCSVGTIGDHIPAAAGGLPESTPQRPATPPPYPAVHDMPPPRSSTVLTDAELKKLEDDLVAARKRTANPAGGAPNP